MRPADNPAKQKSKNARSRGIVLFSGGLDSILAVRVLQAQNIMVNVVIFTAPFFKNSEAPEIAEQLGVKVHLLDFTQELASLINDPPHGFGSALNPCIDCHAQMVACAGKLMHDLNYDFIATGEVLNQRPMSQTRQSLSLVARCSNYARYLVRPLSAKLLEPTLPELEGKIDREQLLNLSGRSRKPQIKLAEQFGITTYPAPAGGCLLTEEGFCRKVRDLHKNEGFDNDLDLWLLRTGRHFRLPGGTKCIVGRNQQENQSLKEERTNQDTLLHTVNIPGPTLLLPGGCTTTDLDLALQLCAAYGDKTDNTTITVAEISPNKSITHSVQQHPKQQFHQFLV